MTNLHFKFSGLSLGSRLCIQSSKNKSRQNRFEVKINGESVLNILIDLKMLSKQVKLQLHDTIYRLRFCSNSLFYILSLSNSHNDVASIQKNRGDKSYRVIVALHIEDENDLFSVCVKDGMLKIGDSTKNRHVHNHTERVWFGAWLYKVIGL